MPTDAELRRQKEFLRDPKEPIGRGSRRAFEPTPEQKDRSLNKKGNKKTKFDPPLRPTIRGNLVERDNDDEFLEFHWNPSSYQIGKSATWSEKSVQGGHPTLEYSGVSLTKVSFELLLNNIGQPHKNHRDVESSLQWLFDRLRPRSKEDADREKGSANRSLPWLNLRDVEAANAPPILVLFGVSRPFTCVLESVEVTTIFQGLGGPGSEVLAGDAKTITNFGAFQRAQSFFNIATSAGELGNPLANHISLANDFDKIARATVSIKLKEYVNDPVTESK